MKFTHPFALLLLIALFVVSCKNDVSDVGNSIQPKEDEIVVKAHVFGLATENYFVEKIYSRPDSFLLGSFKDPKYGTTYGDILAQFKFPFEKDGFRFPENAVVDSFILSLSYRSWFGDKSSTMAATVYRMNTANNFDFSIFYPSNIDPNDYVDFSQSGVKLGERVFTMRDPQGIKDSTVISIMLSNAIRDELFGILKDESIATQKDFEKKFNGMYITSAFGDATMMNIRNRGINAYLYYHYNEKVEGRDTTFVNMITIPANNEVTQVNRFQHPDTAQIRAYLELHDSINYISSPGNIYTRVKLPLKELIKNLQDSVPGKRLVINSAYIYVNAKDVNDDNKAINAGDNSDLALRVPSNMLLIQESIVKDFFSKSGNNLTDSIIHSDYYSTDTTSYYLFNVARLLTNEMNRCQQDTELLADYLDMLLIPVRVSATYDTSGNRTITDVKQQTQMTGVTIRSGKDLKKPMSVDVTYSGF